MHEYEKRMRCSCLKVHSRNDLQVCVREFVRTKIQIRVGCDCLNRVRATLWNMHSTIVQYMPHMFRWGGLRNRLVQASSSQHVGTRQLHAPRGGLVGR